MANQEKRANTGGAMTTGILVGVVLSVATALFVYYAQGRPGTDAKEIVGFVLLVAAGLGVGYLIGTLLNETVGPPPGIGYGAIMAAASLITGAVVASAAAVGLGLAYLSMDFFVIFAIYCAFWGSLAALGSGFAVYSGRR